MNTSKKQFKNVDEYIDSFPRDVAQRLHTIRKIVVKNAPQATEAISYNIPAYKLNGVLVYFAAHQNHIGLYPYSSSMRLSKGELAQYKIGQGTLQFPMGQKLPVSFIQRIVKARVKEKLNKKR